MFLLEIMTIYPAEFIRSLAGVLRPFVKHCVTNPNGDCRALGRKALLVWQQIDPESSERVFHGIEQAMQRAVLEDESRYLVHAVMSSSGTLEQRNHLAHDSCPPVPRI